MCLDNFILIKNRNNFKIKRPKGAHDYPPNSNLPNVYCTEIHLTELPFALIYTFQNYRLT